MRTAPARRPNQNIGDEIPTFTQRVVPANGQAAPTTTGARSVFDVARPNPRGGKKPRLPPLDITNIKAEFGVVMPLPDDGGRSRYEPLLRKLTAVGMSVASPRAYHGAVATAARSYSKKHDVKFSLRKISDDECRLWRTA